jgi:hypothetical protein
LLTKGGYTGEDAAIGVKASGHFARKCHLIQERRADMFEYIVGLFRSLFTEPVRDELLIPVRAEHKRDLLKKRR